MRLRRGFVLVGLSLALLISGCFLFHRQILWGIGSVLVADEAPQKADIGIVLGGDASGNRILRACAAIQEGLIPRSLVSGVGAFYGMHESSLAINLAVSRGCPADFFTAVLFPAHSTFDEAEHLIPELRRLRAHKVLIVTSPSHTARARRIFRRLAPDLEFHSIAARDRIWNDGYWWESREGRKLWLLESAKTVADFIGL